MECRLSRVNELLNLLPTVQRITYLAANSHRLTQPERLLFVCEQSCVSLRQKKTVHFNVNEKEKQNP
jgi:hypothetical protein